jgi:hypothetical protein
MPQPVATGTPAVEGLDKTFGATRVLDQAGLLAPPGRVVALRVRVLDAPQSRPGDTVDRDDVGGPTVGYPRAPAG